MVSVDGWRIERQALLEPRLAEYPYEKWGCEDPRVTQIGPHTWMIAYTAYSPFGPGVALAKTEDFVSVDRLGLVMAPNKDATLFPEKTRGSWLMLHRPETSSGEHIWYASSDDLLHWALPDVLLPTNGGPWWDGLRVGTGAPPIRTEKGWLLIYHGVKEAGHGHPIYRLGLALLDLEDPRSCWRALPIGSLHRRLNMSSAGWCPMSFTLVVPWNAMARYGCITVAPILS